MAADARPLLIVAAWKPELRGLSAAGLRRARVPVARAAVGVGLIEAAAGAAAAIARLRPRAVVLVGTAGVYPGVGSAGGAGGGAGGAVKIGDVAVVARVHLASLAVARGAAYLPGPMPALVETAAKLRRALAVAGDAPVLDVACPLGITKTRSAARALSVATGATLENLEAFAVARAAAAARVPFAAVLGITNVVGPDAHAQWRENAERAAAAACARVVAWVAGGALGR